MRHAVAALAVAAWLLSGCAARPPAHASHRVEIKLIRFTPAALQVAVGDTVRWTNLDVVPHTATSTTGAFDSGTLAPGSSWELVVSRAGVMDYTCLVHPTMKGSITASP